MLGPATLNALADFDPDGVAFQTEPASLARVAIH